MASLCPNAQILIDYGILWNMLHRTAEQHTEVNQDVCHGNDRFWNSETMAAASARGGISARRRGKELIESSSMACWTSTLMTLRRCRTCLMKLFMHNIRCVASLYAHNDLLCGDSSIPVC